MLSIQALPDFFLTHPIPFVLFKAAGPVNNGPCPLHARSGGWPARALQGSLTVHAAWLWDNSCFGEGSIFQATKAQGQLPMQQPHPYKYLHGA